MGKTFLSLFCEFSRDELCQLYIYPTLPDVDVCHSYYRITDRNVFESYWHFGKVNGREVTIKDIDTTKHEFYENEKEESFIRIKKTALKTLFRDLMWKLSKWYTNELKDWIEEERPTCVFLAPGEAKFIYDVAIKIAEQYNLPIIAYICDEFYYVNKTEGMIDGLRIRLLQKKIRELMSKTQCIVAISNEINRQYAAEFSVPAETVMTGASVTIQPKVRVNEVFNGITYLGNLAYDRISSLIDIGKALDEINEKNKTEVKLYLYTRSLSDTLKKRLSEVKSIEYCGYVTGQEFTEKLLNADALLHIESFSEVYVDKVKNSISTKIADSLASGNPLVAYAPAEIASMRYLISSEAALTITQKDELKSKLESFVFSVSLRQKIATKGLETAQKNHVTIDNSLKLYHIFETVVSSAENRDGGGR